VVLKLTAAGKPVDNVALEAPLLAAFVPGEKRRYVPLAGIPRRMIDAVVAIEDRRFFDGQVRFEIVPASKGKRDKIALATFKKEHRAEQITAPVVTLGACSRDR
jgi:hypothetical protein